MQNGKQRQCWQKRVTEKASQGTISSSQLKPALNVGFVTTVSLRFTQLISTHMFNYNDSDLGSTVDLDQYLTGKLVLSIHVTNIV